MTLQSGPDQERCVERFKAVCRWGRTEESLRVDEWCDHRSRVSVEVDDAKVGTMGDEARDDTVVFFRLTRAGRINEASTCSYDVGRSDQQRHLIACKRCQVPLLPPPTNIRISPHSSKTRARRIDEDRIEARLK